MYGFAMLCSGHYRQTMDFAVRYHQLATPLGALQFGEQGGRAVWTFSPLPNPRVDAYLYRFIVDMQFAIMLTLHRDLMGPGFAASEFRATYRAPDDAAIYPDLFGAPFSFEHDRNELVFDAGWLDRTPSLANQISYATMTALCDAQLDEFKLRLGLAGKVRQMLMMNLMQPFTFEQAAQGLNMSARTLRRRLHDEHTSFRELADQLRMTMAVRYLRDTDLTVEEIAAGLGFSDAANFRHAFRRWTRAAPRDFRGLSGRV
jgi:AraC-like DNA-binding protein